LRVARSLALDGAAYAQPIVVGNNVIVATEHDTVYSVDATSGHLAWRRQLGAPTPRSALPCGNIDPSGITGSPAYDAGTHLVFVVTETGDAHHTLVALDARTGAVRWRRDVDVLSNRDRHAEQERGALLVAAGRVYVAFGGRLGDCGNYVGYVVASALDGAGPLLHYAIPTAREGGIWAPPGPVVGPGGDLYVSVGNGAEVGGRYDGSDSVVRLSPTLHRKALFAPSTWPQDNAADLDLGSMSPAVVGDHIVVAGKRGEVYLLNAALGGIGGQLATLSGCAGFGGAAVRGTVVVLPCNDGLRALRVTGDSMHWLWRDGSVKGSPVIAGDAVYGFDGSDLVELSLSDGHTRGRVSVGPVTRFTTPVPHAGTVIVATTSRLVTVAGTA
jgi:outer membrane protein assembly factor BamB